MMQSDRRLIIQIRAIRCYAHALHLTLDQAAQRWVDTGCACRWAIYYELHEEE